MSKCTVHNEKESTSRRSSQTTGQSLSGVSLAHDLHGNRRPSDSSDVTNIPDNNVLIVDWDGPNDPSNPKKSVDLQCAHDERRHGCGTDDI